MITMNLQQICYDAESNGLDVDHELKHIFFNTQANYMMLNGTSNRDAVYEAYQAVTKYYQNLLIQHKAGDYQNESN